MDKKKRFGAYEAVFHDFSIVLFHYRWSQLRGAFICFFFPIRIGDFYQTGEKLRVLNNIFGRMIGHFGTYQAYGLVRNNSCQQRIVNLLLSSANRQEERQTERGRERVRERERERERERGGEGEGI